MANTSDVFCFIFSNQFIQDLHVLELKYIFMKLKQSAVSQNICCLILILAVCFAVFPERRSDSNLTKN